MFIKFPSIEQFRTVVKQVSEETRYANSEKDENGRPLPAPKTWKNPIMSFTGTVKIHGTNAGVIFDTQTGEIFAQSRNRALSLTNDNAGFALWVKSKENHFTDAFKTFATDRRYLVLYGEWAGPGIQKGVGVSNLEKVMFFPFALASANDSKDRVFMSNAVLYLFDSIDDIYNVNDIWETAITIDFENPAKVQNTLIKITEEVEAECPVAKFFGVSGIGEGVVWTHLAPNGNQYIFKVKGEKHSVSNVKTLAPVDIEKLEAIQEFVEYALTEERLKQGIAFLKEMEHPITPQSTPHFLRWIVGDILKEETDTIVGNGLDSKNVNKEVSTKARIWYLNEGLSYE